MKHLILILLMCICSNIAAFTYQLPADTRRVDTKMKCESCGEYYIVSMLYSEQIDTYFTNDFHPCYHPEDHFMCSSCRESERTSNGVKFLIIIILGGILMDRIIRSVNK